MPIRVASTQKDNEVFYVTEQLKSTIKILKEYSKDDPDWEVDIGAIKYAIKELENHDKRI
ncbi:hypothetical protein [Senegalia massiliensis]|uniref:hypothetical protein n=1 Tax=Senegalia massiliensis TaxID=1720316 RepID=UPI0010312004|nr:hypothetical protein [Senegalia massiliensis]